MYEDVRITQKANVSVRGCSEGPLHGECIGKCNCICFPSQFVTETLTLLNLRPKLKLTLCYLNLTAYLLLLYDGSD